MIDEDEFLVDVITSSSHSGSIGLGVKGVTASGTSSIFNDNIIVDQSCLNDLQITTSTEFGQSFVAGTSGRFHSVTIQTKFSHSYSGTGTMQLRSGSGFSGTVLATEQVTMTPSIGEKVYWFTSPPNVSSGSTYTIHFNFTNGSGSMEVSAQTGNNYTNGILYQPAAFPSADLYFKTHIGIGPLKPLSSVVPATDESYQYVNFPNPIVKSIKRKNPLASTVLANDLVFEVDFDSTVVEVTSDDFSLNSTVGGTVDSVVALSGTKYEVYVSNLNNANGTVELTIKGNGGASGINNILSKKFGDTLTVNLDHDNDYLNQSKIGQTFKAKTNTQLRRVTFFPKDGVHSFSGTATMRVVSGNDLLSGSTNLLTQTINISTNTSSEGQTIGISPGIPLVAGNVYSIVFENFTGSGGQAFASSTNGGYSDGHVIFTGFNTPSHGGYDLKLKIYEEGYGFGADLDTVSPVIVESYTVIPTLSCSVDVVSDASCGVASDGSLSVVPIGVPGPYTYMWSNGGVTQTISGLAQGTYTVTVTSSTGGTQTAQSSGTVGVSNTLTATVIVDSNATCNGFSNGGASASISGGVAPFNYAWSNGGTTAAVTGVVAGVYSVTVTDNGGCTSTNTNVISQPSMLITNAVVDSNNICNGFSGGGATASATGGTSPYTYVWNNAATTASITGVVAGTYTITTTDNNGCTSTSSSTDH